ncbi:glycosyltransferase family 2 protein [Celeribacter sp.]|uniref:glycosyltransferase family 2 protein n=1 Tax=Celeribacter sp. TaxID=1890673 RepID=UPI003A8EB460
MSKFARTQSAPCEVLVVNRGGGSAQSLLRDHLDLLRVIDVDENLTEGAARNIGVDASMAGHVVFLEAGVMPMRDWVERLHAAHLEGYAVVPSSVRPEDGASEAALAFWLWHYGAALPVADLSEVEDRPLSYARSLFDHFGYFPPGRDGGSANLFNARLLRKVELATDAAADLIYSFASDPQTAEDALRQHARARQENRHLRRLRRRAKAVRACHVKSVFHLS